MKTLLLLISLTNCCCVNFSIYFNNYFCFRKTFYYVGCQRFFTSGNFILTLPLIWNFILILDWNYFILYPDTFISLIQHPFSLILSLNVLHNNNIILESFILSFILAEILNFIPLSQPKLNFILLSPKSTGPQYYVMFISIETIADWADNC